MDAVDSKDSKSSRNILERFLGLFADVRGGEGYTVLLLALNVDGGKARHRNDCQGTTDQLPGLGSEDEAVRMSEWGSIPLGRDVDGDDRVFH